MLSHAVCLSTHHTDTDMQLRLNIGQRGLTVNCLLQALQSGLPCLSVSSEKVPGLLDRLSGYRAESSPRAPGAMKGARGPSAGLSLCTEQRGAFIKAASEPPTRSTTPFALHRLSETTGSSSLAETLTGSQTGRERCCITSMHAQTRTEDDTHLVGSCVR